MGWLVVADGGGGRGGIRRGEEDRTTHTQDGASAHPGRAGADQLGGRVAGQPAGLPLTAMLLKPASCSRRRHLHAKPSSQLRGKLICAGQ